MKSLEYVKAHYKEFEADYLLDQRWTNRFLDFLPVEEWGQYGLLYSALGEENS